MEKMVRAFNEIEITNNEDGKPEISFLGETAATIAEMNPGKISVFSFTS